MNIFHPDEKTRGIVYTALIIYWLILLTLTSLPSYSLPDVPGSDKIKHFVAYAGLTVLLSAAFLVQRKNSTLRKHAFLISVFLAVIYGIVDEIHQMLIPGRDAEFLDWLADFGGAVTGSLAIFLYYIYQKKISS